MSTPTTPDKPSIVAVPNAIAWEIGGSTDELDGLSHYLCEVLRNGVSDSVITLEDDGIVSMAPILDGAYTCIATAVDVSGHNSTASPTSDPIAIYLTRPDCALTISSPTGSNSSCVTFTCTFSVDSSPIPVTGMAATGFVVENASIGNIVESSPGVYTVDLHPINTGPFSVYAAQGAGVSDYQSAEVPGGTQSRMSNKLTFYYHGTRPSVTLTYDSAITKMSAIDLHVCFSDDVTGSPTGFCEGVIPGTGAICVTGANVAAVYGNGRYYIIRLVPIAATGVNVITAKLSAEAATDSYGNKSLESNLLTIRSNTDVPVISRLMGSVI